MTKNKKYTKIEKEILTKRLLPPENCSITTLSNETGISKSTLSTWKSKALNPKHTNMKSLSQQSKFMIVMETFTLSETELAKYCRTNGIFVEDIKKWRINCIESNSKKSVDIASTKELKNDLELEKKKRKGLEKELRRKEKAFAETAALLVLRKKLDAIFEDNEED
ncbi:MAG: hypothetical protein GY928_11145 [Colwellia sp.]|nr:hypothetical protein [Colwellia sp.]